jgi:hypothetical protein
MAEQQQQRQSAGNALLAQFHVVKLAALTDLPRAFTFVGPAPGVLRGTLYATKTRAHMPARAFWALLTHTLHRLVATGQIAHLSITRRDGTVVDLATAADVTPGVFEGREPPAPLSLATLPISVLVHELPPVADVESLEFMDVDPPSPSLAAAERAARVTALRVVHGIQAHQDEHMIGRCLRCGLADVGIVARPCDHAALCRACYAYYATTVMHAYCPDPSCVDLVDDYVALEALDA